MLFRLRHTGGAHYFAGNWISQDGMSTALAPTDISMEPTEIARVAGRDIPVGWRLSIASRDLIHGSTDLLNVDGVVCRDDTFAFCIECPAEWAAWWPLGRLHLHLMACDNERFRRFGLLRMYTCGSSSQGSSIISCVPLYHTMCAPLSYHVCPSIIPCVPLYHTMCAPLPYHVCPSTIPCVPLYHTMCVSMRTVTCRWGGSSRTHVLLQSCNPCCNQHTCVHT